MAGTAARLMSGLVCLLAVSGVEAQQFPKGEVHPVVRAIVPQLNDPTALADPHAQLDLLRELANLPAAPQGVVVMTDGRTFSGTIKEQPGGYRVEFSGTYMTVPFEYALVTAATLQDAYTKLRDSVPRHTAESHMKLAEWCRTQGLLDESLQEVGTALKMEPLRSDARQLLRELQQQRPQPADSSPEEPRPVAMTADGFTRPEDRTTLGLSRDSMQSYIRHVQPLILNKCGNRGCHGSASPQTFSVIAVGGLVHQKTRSEENLAAILEQISRTDPINSPLIRKPLESTPAHQSVFAGSTGRKQYALLTDWVQQVLREQPGGLATAITTSTAVRPASAETQSTAETPQPRVAATQSHNSPQPAVTAEFITQVLAEERPDAFDPAAFNRRVHGTASASTLTGGSSHNSGAANNLSAPPSPSEQRFSGLEPLPSLQTVPR